MKVNRYFSTIITAALAMGGSAMSMNIAHAATVTWDFNLPATGLPSVSPPYPSLATLTLVDTVDGVQFTLDPNEAHPGYDQSIPTNSTVDRLNIVYTGGDLLSTAYEWISGPVANAESFANQQGTQGPFVAVVPPPGSATNMDAGYESEDGQLLLNWNNPDFMVTDSSVWLIAGTTIANNFSILSSANNKPSPTFGIFSVSSFSDFPGAPNPNPSNWVTGPNPVPVPAAVWLFGSGLLGLVGVARRKRS